MPAFFLKKSAMFLTFDEESGAELGLYVAAFDASVEVGRRSFRRKCRRAGRLNRSEFQGIAQDVRSARQVSSIRPVTFGLRRTKH